MREHYVAGRAVKAFAQPLCHIFIREMARARKYTLLQFPGINVASLEHVAAVIGLYDDGGASPQALHYQSRDVAEIHQRGDADARVRRRKTEVVSRVMRNRE